MDGAHAIALLQVAALRIRLRSCEQVFLEWGIQDQSFIFTDDSPSFLYPLSLRLRLQFYYPVLERRFGLLLKVCLGIFIDSWGQGDAWG